MYECVTQNRHHNIITVWCVCLTLLSKASVDDATNILTLELVDIKTHPQT